jgi:cytochrome oxidase Cu insertion factor (SCO1/SenC/PrrC family)
MNKTKLFSIVGFFAFIIGIPILSVMASRNGLKRLQAVKKELSVYDAAAGIPSFKYINQDGQAISALDFRGRLTVANFIQYPCDEPCQKAMQNMEKISLMMQRDNKKHVMLLSFLQTPQDSNFNAKTFMQQFPNAADNWHLVQGDVAPTKAYTDKLFADKNTQVLAPNSFILVDTMGQVKKFYDGLNDQEISTMLEHMYYIAPKRKRDKLQYKADNEL